MFSFLRGFRETGRWFVPCPEPAGLGVARRCWVCSVVNEVSTPGTPRLVRGVDSEGPGDMDKAGLEL